MAGQASVETVIASATILMFLPAIAAMFQYAEVRQWLDQVARYVVWERSVWAEPTDGRWNLSDGVDEADRIITRDDQTIARQAMARVGTNRREVMKKTSAAEVQSVVREQFALPGLMGWSNDKRATGRQSMFVDRSARVASQVSTDLSMGSPERSAVINTLATGKADIELGAVEQKLGLQLSDQTTAQADLSVDLVNLFSSGPIDSNPLDYDEMMGKNPLGQAAGETIELTTSAALHTNPWSPKNEDVFRQKVHNLDAKKLVQIGAGLASLGLAPGLDAAQAPLNDDAQAQLDNWMNFAPFTGAINKMPPELHQNSADIPFNRVQLYDFQSNESDNPQQAISDGSTPWYAKQP